MQSFIDTDEIGGLLARTSSTQEKVRAVLQKALSKNRLTLEETAILVTATEPELVEEIKASVRKLKKEVYGEHPSYTPDYIAETVRTVPDRCRHKT